MSKELYNYGLAKDVAAKVRDGMFSGGYQYTADTYFSAEEAGTKLGVDAANIEVVLKFSKDGEYKQGPDVAPNANRGFVGGASQFEHSGRPKPIEKRIISETNWSPV